MVFDQRIRCAGFVVVLFTCVVCPVSAAPSGTASSVVQRLNDTLLEAMKSGDKAGFSGRYERLGPVIEDTHNLQYIARFSIGKKSWEALEPAQQERFLETFRDYSVSTYAERFNSFDGEQFEITLEQAAKRGRIQVTSILHLAKEDIDFEYILDQQDGKWKIVNIIVQGVSDLALKRAEYKTLLAGQGFEALMEHISEQTDNLRNQAR